MSEGLTTEIAHKMAEHRPRESTGEWILEITEALLLSMVAVITAWCGYQAAKWDGRQAYLYGTSERLSVEAAVKATEGGQLRLLDVVTFNTWIKLRKVRIALLLVAGSLLIYHLIDLSMHPRL